MFSYYVAKAIHDEQQREIERRLRFKREAPEPPPRISVRKRLGRGLIRIGSSLASDAPLRLAARR